MRPVALLMSLILLLFVSSSSSATQDDIISVIEQYDRAVLEKNGVLAASLVDKVTTDYFELIRQLALAAPAEAPPAGRSSYKCKSSPCGPPSARSSCHHYLAGGSLPLS